MQGLFPARGAALILLAGALACASNTARTDDAAAAPSDTSAAGRDTLGGEARNPAGYRGMERDTSQVPSGADTGQQAEMDSFRLQQQTGRDTLGGDRQGLEQPDTAGGQQQQQQDQTGAGQQQTDTFTTQPADTGMGQPADTGMAQPTQPSDTSGYQGQTDTTGGAGAGGDTTGAGYDTTGAGGAGGADTSGTWSDTTSGQQDAPSR
jgi:hypothetical protein